MPLCLVTSFMMTKGSIQNDKTISGLETEKSAWKDLINAAKEATKATKDEKSTKKQQGNTQEQEEIIESIMIFENAQSLLKEADVVPATSGSVTTDTSGNGTPTTTVTANASSTAVPSAQPVEQPAETSSGDEAKEEAIKKGSNEAEELKQITTQFEQLNTFTLWFISIENDKKKKEQIENKIKTISETLKKLENGQQSANSTKDSSKPNSGDKTVVRDSFNPFRKKEAKEAKEEQQTPESLKQNIEQLKKELDSISLPDKSSTEQELQKFFQDASIDNTLITLFKSGSVEPNSVSDTVSKLVDFLEKNNKQGFFCLAWTPQSQTELKDDMKDVKRQYYFFEKPNFIAYAKPSKVKEEEEWITSKLNLFKSQGII